AAEADRGLTDDDIAEQAREDAGLEPAPARADAPEEPRREAPAKPRVGDTRPGTPPPAAGPAEAPAKKRRRRRGGRGRGKGGSGATTPETQGGWRPKCIEAAARYVDGGAPRGGVDFDGITLPRLRDSGTPSRCGCSYGRGR